MCVCVCMYVCPLLSGLTSCTRQSSGCGMCGYSTITTCANGTSKNSPWVCLNYIQYFNFVPSLHFSTCPQCTCSSISRSFKWLLNYVIYELVHYVYLYIGLRHFVQCPLESSTPDEVFRSEIMHVHIICHTCPLGMHDVTTKCTGYVWAKRGIVGLTS